MANARQEVPIIAKLNALGKKYISLAQRRNFFEKAVGRHRNSKGAHLLENLTTEDIKKTDVHNKWAYYLELLKGWQTYQNPPNSPEIAKWINPNLYEKALFDFKLFNYLRTVVEDAKEGSIFLPEIHDLLTNFYHIEGSAIKTAPSFIDVLESEFFMSVNSNYIAEKERSKNSLIGYNEKLEEPSAVRFHM